MSLNILLSKEGGVGIVRLNRPQASNALSKALLQELLQGLAVYEMDDEIGAIIVTGSDTVFCAGADLKEQKDLTFYSSFMSEHFRAFTERIQAIRKPIIAAVNGYALGGGFELAMLCDTIFAGQSTKFGQPEIKIGTIPGAGGTQRLTKAIGKAKTMDLVLTGRMITGEEALEWGVVARVLPDDQVLAVAVEAARTIASYSRPMVYLAKEAINAAEEMSLSQGLMFERRLFHSTFALNDAKEGMEAFVQKRAPNFRHN
ncbi:enoyl-CoA hydratase/isomerase [Cantharellus anzutake]|uniref:enoyl-CoA hydratase/isomerase n=1 Tax=Cantharellus anzutake TaxID=1750568 RepID=UPI0019062330|nr:enoyl-CoA hydratase/isomerase [Cantharellus anzutake]KAF8335866.1 enoyl-CoA hydratase/isomerase [Cantharellus anzutake]